MQDIRQTFGLSPEDETQVRNRAAVSLAEAMHRARSQQADHDSMKFEARAISMARLEALRKKLAPLYSAIPRDVELFDLGLVANERPRLFVDIIAFIEMNRDQTGYRFLQETRSGRVMLAETADDAEIVERVTDYVARRLIERERALAADAALGAPVPEPAGTPPLQTAVGEPDAVEPEEVALETSQHPPTPTEAASPPASMPRAMPMTAEEAFRQWSAAPKSTIQDPIKETDLSAHESEKAVLAEVAPERVDVRPIDKPAPAASYIDPMTGAPVVTGESIRHAKVETIDRTAAEIEKAVERIVEQPQQSVIPAATASLKPAMAAATATAATTAATARATMQTAAAPVRSSGWWLWPILALLIGTGMGALGLYLWAANMMR